jgi:hypothetical protein
MAVLPEEVSKAWENQKGPIILSTVNKEGIPNSIYATCVSKYSEDTLVVANNYFSKTLENIEAGSSVLQRGRSASLACPSRAVFSREQI